MKDKAKAALMGRKVRVLSVYWKDYERKEVVGGSPTRYRDHVVWNTRDLKTPRTGWIVGMRSLQEGTLDYDGDGGFLNQTGRVSAILVCYWPTLKPVKVPYDGYDAVDHGEPISPQQRSWDSMPKHTKEGLRTYMRELMNDENLRDAVTGRFK